MANRSSKNSRRKGVRTTKESKSGRNTHFKDGKKQMTRSEFVKEIKNGNYKGYTVKVINGKATLVSKPDKSKGNNLD